MSNFIADFLEYNSGTECHKNFLRWSAIAALGAAAGPRYRLLNGTYYIYPLFDIIFVGAQGTRKTYAMTRTKNLIMEAFPDYTIGADTTSRDDLIRQISSDETERAFIDQDGVSDTYHPLALYISEFKDFCAYSPTMMINFVVNIYDYVDRIYKCSTIKRGAEDSKRPFLSVLACENTDWFLKRLKEGVVTGGFSRRFNVIYEWDRPDKPIPRIIKPKDGDAIHTRMVNHLRLLHTASKNFQWTKEGQEVFDKWYHKNFYTIYNDASVAGFMSSKDQQVLKLCIALEVAKPEGERKYLITGELVEEGLAWYGAIEPNLKKLYSSGGRNELAAEQVKILDIIESNGGIMLEKEVLRLTGKDLSQREQAESIKHLSDTEQIIRKAFQWPDEKHGVKTWLVSPKGLKDGKVLTALKKFA